MVTVELVVTGMHCGSCSALIEESLAERAGVVRASVDLEAERAVVDYEPATVDVSALCAAVEEAGYGATPLGGPDPGT